MRGRSSVPGMSVVVACADGRNSVVDGSAAGVPGWIAEGTSGTQPAAQRVLVGRGLGLLRAGMTAEEEFGGEVVSRSADDHDGGVGDLRGHGSPSERERVACRDAGSGVARPREQAASPPHQPVFCFPTASPGTGKRGSSPGIRPVPTSAGGDRIRRDGQKVFPCVDGPGSPPTKRGWAPVAGGTLLGRPGAQPPFRAPTRTRPFCLWGWPNRFTYSLVIKGNDD